MSNIINHKISVIVPAYNQAKTIVADIKRIDKTLHQIRYPYEVIVVVDGYGDKTYRQAKKIKSPNIKVIV